MRDDLSGFGEWPDKSFSDLWFSFDQPGHPQQFESSGRAAELVSGTDLDGEWLLETELPSDAPVGEYPITYVSAADGPAIRPWSKAPSSKPSRGISVSKTCHRPVEQRGRLLRPQLRWGASVPG